MNLLIGLGFTLLAIRGLVALWSDACRAGRAISAGVKALWGWCWVRWHAYCLRRDKARSRRKDALEACALEVINLQAQQIADLNAKVALLGAPSKPKNQELSS